MWIEVLKVVAAKSTKAFRFLTCGTKDITAFKMQYMDDGQSEEEDQNPAEDVGGLKLRGGVKALQGFTAPTTDYSQSFAQNLAKGDTVTPQHQRGHSENTES